MKGLYDGSGALEEAAGCEFWSLVEVLFPFSLGPSLIRVATTLSTFPLSRRSRLAFLSVSVKPMSRNAANFACSSESVIS